MKDGAAISLTSKLRVFLDCGLIITDIRYWPETHRAYVFDFLVGRKAGMVGDPGAHFEIDFF